MYYTPQHFQRHRYASLSKLAKPRKQEEDYAPLHDVQNRQRTGDHQQRLETNHTEETDKAQPLQSFPNNYLRNREEKNVFLPQDGYGSFRPRVVSALSRFGPESFRPGSFRPGSIRPWVVSAYLFSTIRLVTEGQLNTFLANWRVHGSW